MPDSTALEVVQAYYMTFMTDHGQRVLKDLMQTFEHRSSFVPNDPYTTAFNEGERSVVLKIRLLIDLGRDPTQFLPTEEESPYGGANPDPEPGTSPFLRDTKLEG